MMKRPQAIYAFLLAAILLGRGPLSADIDAILDAGSENEKGQKAVRYHKNPPVATEVIQLVRKERSDLICFLVMGQYLEHGQFQTRNTTGSVLTMAARKGALHKVAAMTAFSPHVDKILKELMKGSSGHALAAYIMAAYERAESYERGELPTVGGPYQPTKYRDHRKGGAETTEHLKKLLKSTKKDIVELALLAIGFKQDPALAEDVANMKVMKDLKVQAAHQFAMARLGKPLDAEVMKNAFTKKERMELGYSRLSPKLSSYQINGPSAMYACWAAGAAKDKKMLSYVHKALSHRDLRVSFDAAVALEQIAAPESLPFLFAKLKVTRNWNIRVACYSAIGAIPDAKSVAPLLERFAKETGRLRQDINYALASICGKQHGTHRQEWYTWWEENRPRFKADLNATTAFRKEHRVQDMETPSLTSFYGAGIISDRAVFVLDSSMSMKGDKIVSLQNTMKSTLNNMPDHMKFNIVDFGGVINDLFKGLIPASQKAKAEYEVDNFQLTFGTRTFDAIEKGVETDGLDSIIYLSDGAPYSGQFQDWHRIRRAFALLGKHRPISMTCIYFSKGGGGNNKKKKGGMVHAGMTPFSYQNWGISMLPDEEDAPKD